jgi:hypothetical protein
VQQALVAHRAVLDVLVGLDLARARLEAPAPELVELADAVDRLLARPVGVGEDVDPAAGLQEEVGDGRGGADRRADRGGDRDLVGDQRGRVVEQ